MPVIITLLIYYNDKHISLKLQENSVFHVAPLSDTLNSEQHRCSVM